MPYDWVEPEKFMEHRGLTVYHIYRNDSYADGTSDYWYTFSIQGCETDSHGEEGTFDVRDLPKYIPEGSVDELKDFLRDLIDTGYFDKWELGNGTMLGEQKVA